MSTEFVCKDTAPPLFNVNGNGVNGEVRGRLATLRQRGRYVGRYLLVQAALCLCMLGAFSVGVGGLCARAAFGAVPTPEAGRRLLASAIRAYLRLLQRLSLVTVQVRGLPDDTVLGPAVYVANHPSLLDALLFIGRFPTCACVVKHRVSRFSPYAAAVRLTGYIVQRPGHDVVTASLEELAQGRSVIIFPEGTRSAESSGRWKFHRGAATVAVRGGVPLIPVILRWDPPALGRGRRWFEAPDRECMVEMQFCDPMKDAVELASDGTSWRASRRITNALESFYAEAFR